jgi:NAD(P)-dependent dehydrogenase (short-subunit alcohol dehydrogenase family)
MIDDESHDRHFAVNSRAVAILMGKSAGRIIEKQKRWGRIINISADCAWGAPMEISYRASKYVLECHSRSAAAELGPHGITVNIVSPGDCMSDFCYSKGLVSLHIDNASKLKALNLEAFNALVE